MNKTYVLSIKSLSSCSWNFHGLLTCYNFCHTSVPVSIYKAINLSSRLSNGRRRSSQIWLEPCGFSLSNHHFLFCYLIIIIIILVSSPCCAVVSAAEVPEKRHDHLTFPSPPLLCSFRHSPSPSSCSGAARGMRLFSSKSH
jgi:hypothetical protein